MVLTPTDGCDPQVLAAVLRVWETLGLRCEVMTRADHDWIYAVISQLPHLLSLALLRRGQGLFDDPARLMACRAARSS